jgi:hypothetical protein
VPRGGPKGSRGSPVGAQEGVQQGHILFQRWFNAHIFVCGNRSDNTFFCAMLFELVAEEEEQEKEEEEEEKLDVPNYPSL